MRTQRTLYFVALVVLLVNVDLGVLCFNLEPRIPVIKSGHSGTYFGYSVAEHITLPSAHSRLPRGPLPRILVGAPRAQSGQIGTNHSGAIFSCPLTTNEHDCEQLSIDDSAPVFDDELKDDQWLGVTVKSQGPGGFVMVCAHRYVKKGENYRWGNGICYSLTQNLDFDNTFDPCLDRPVAKAHEQYGYCQAGTSGVIAEDNSIVIGTPGPYTWRGTVFTNSIAQEIRDDISWFMGPVLDQAAPVDKYSYLGMSVTSGKFFKNKMSYVAGAPRANSVGQVVFFTKERGNTTLHVQLVLSGEVFASSFGYELATADLNKDGLPDLIVGAPFYYDKDAGGAIYIYMNSKQGISKHAVPIRITGKEESRFGFSIANCSDLNKDGFEDIAVGAPYEENGRVYIYLGAKNGIVTEPAQIIKAEDLPILIRTFGYSLSGGLDMDANNYPDLVVGAYEDDKVVMLRARPIIGIITSVEGHEHNIVDPSSHGCDDDPNSQHVCFSFKACFQITSVEALNTRFATLNLNYTIEAETFQGKKISRVFFKNANHAEVKHIVQQKIVVPETNIFSKRCNKEVVYLAKNTRDILNPIKFKMTYSLLQETPVPARRGANIPDINRYPILNQQEATKIFQATFEKDCGTNDICESDLRTTARLPKGNELVLGEFNEVELEVSVINRHESAYEAAIYVTHSPSLGYIGRISENNQYPCLPYNNTVVVCTLGNPFKRGLAPVEITLRFSPYKLELDTETSVQFTVKANSTSKELSPEHDIVIKASVVRVAEIVVTGSSDSDQVFYGGEIRGAKSMKDESDIGSVVNHTYVVKNNGPSHVGLVTLVISWPYEVYPRNREPHGKYILYLVEMYSSPSTVSCTIPEEYNNPLGVTTLKLLGGKQPTTESPYQNVRHDLGLDGDESGVTPESTQEEHTRESSSTYHETSRTRQTVQRTRTVSKETRTWTEESSSRTKREAEPAASSSSRKRTKTVTLECRDHSAKCFNITCTIYSLHKHGSATVKLRARLWNSTFVSDYSDVDMVIIRSQSHLLHDASSLIIKKTTDQKEAHDAETQAQPDILRAQKPQDIPIWIYIVAAVVGIILLIGLIFCLYMVGFFNRKKHDEMMNKGAVEKHNDFH